MRQAYVQNHRPHKTVLRRRAWLSVLLDWCLCDTCTCAQRYRLGSQNRLGRDCQRRLHIYGFMFGRVDWGVAVHVRVAQVAAMRDVRLIEQVISSPNPTLHAIWRACSCEWISSFCRCKRKMVRWGEPLLLDTIQPSQ